MSNVPGAQAVLQSVARLAGESREVQAAMAQVEAAHQGRVQLEQRRDRAARETVRSTLTSEQQRIQDAHAAARARHEERLRARLVRLRQAVRAARKQSAERIDAEEGRRRFLAQKDSLKATRERDARRAEADATRVEAESRVAGLEATLGSLEAKARAALGVYGRGFVDVLNGPLDTSPPAVGAPQRIAEAETALVEAAQAVDRFQRGATRRILGAWPILVVLALLPLPLVPAAQHFGWTGLTYARAGLIVGAIVALFLIVLLMGRALARGAAVNLGERWRQARDRVDLARRAVAADHAQALAAAEAAFEDETHRIQAGWEEAQSAAEARRAEETPRMEQRAARAQERLERLQATWRRREEERRDRALAQAAEQQAAGERAADRLKQEREAGLERERRLALDPLQERSETAWRDAEILLRSAREHPAAAVPAWLPERWADWKAPTEFPGAVRWGELRLEEEAGTARPAEEGQNASGTVPMLQVFPESGSVWIEAAGAPGRETGAAVLNLMVLRLLATAPPGRVAFTIIDPVGLGRSFASLLHLVDEAPQLMGGKVWTQAEEIEERIEVLTQHVERVIQMYLRNEYATIAEYNARAGRVAEKYHFLVVMDLPQGFTESALRRLAHLAASGPRCGVFLLVVAPPSPALPPDVSLASLRQGALHLLARDGGLAPAGLAIGGARLVPDPLPEPALATRLLQRIARASVDSNRVEVPFEQVAPRPEEMWNLDTAAELRVPIGRTGATRLQYLSLGRGTRQHALVAGKTGSGKSTLFHVVITNLALWCRPDQVEFYLVDFKKGVEFKAYGEHRLPHARVVAIASDREFGLSVLQRLDDELRRRGELFRAAGVQDLPGYRRSPGALPSPRVLLVIDEFQEFFVEEDRVAQGAAVLLDRIVRQGRAFGIHVFLGSQTLGGAYTMARSTLGQMVVRIALQCNEADALLIMDDQNPAARLLSRPGEGIYNDAAGAKEGNSPFQTVWIDDEERDRRLAAVTERARAEAVAVDGPVVFEGDAPGHLAENPVLQQHLAGAPTDPDLPRSWIGSPNSIKGPTEVAWINRGGGNLLIVGQRDDAIVGILTAAVLSLAAQFRPDRARFVLLDPAPGDTALAARWEEVARIVPQRVDRSGIAGAERWVGEVWNEWKARGEEGAAAGPRLFLVIRALQQFSRLRPEEDFGFGGGAGGVPPPGEQLRQLIAEGPARGIHVAVAVDSLGDVLRCLGRKALPEFGTRVLFQMSANDSAGLMEGPEASRLGMHRALLYREREGQAEVFRPYAAPDPAWLAAAAAQLARRRAEAGDGAGPSY